MKPPERLPSSKAGKLPQWPPLRLARPVSFWTAVDMILGAIAAAALIIMILEGI